MAIKSLPRSAFRPLATQLTFNEHQLVCSVVAVGVSSQAVLIGKGDTNVGNAVVELVDLLGELFVHGVSLDDCLVLDLVVAHVGKRQVLGIRSWPNRKFCKSRALAKSSSNARLTDGVDVAECRVLLSISQGDEQDRDKGAENQRFSHFR